MKIASKRIKIPHFSGRVLTRVDGPKSERGGIRDQEVCDSIIRALVIYRSWGGQFIWRNKAYADLCLNHIVSPWRVREASQQDVASTSIRLVGQGILLTVANVFCNFLAN